MPLGRIKRSEGRVLVTAVAQGGFFGCHLALPCPYPENAPCVLPSRFPASIAGKQAFPKYWKRRRQSCATQGSEAVFRTATSPPHSPHRPAGLDRRRTAG